MAASAVHSKLAPDHACEQMLSLPPCDRGRTERRLERAACRRTITHRKSQCARSVHRYPCEWEILFLLYRNGRTLEDFHKSTQLDERPVCVCYRAKLDCLRGTR